MNYDTVESRIGRFLPAILCAALALLDLLLIYDVRIAATVLAIGILAIVIERWPLAAMIVAVAAAATVLLV